MSLCGHPGAAPSEQGSSPGPGRHRPFSLRGSACGARPQCPPGLQVYFRSGGAPRVFYTGASAWAPRGGPLTQGLFLGPGRHRLFSPRGSTRGARPQCPPGLAKHPQSGAAASGRATASEPNQPREHNPSRHFIFLSPRSRSGRGARSEPAFRNRSPHRLLGIQGSQGESKRHPSLGKTALAMGG
ncbi:hypothetical protein NDU88_001087 [Pleurodeles waltl]|uniref:Uncharacterized protein n=1 Tax=Pleurodeles waltl TaxID=8319 RepID=A0AAV7RBY7_PLEWA|nr:hypothetical protein NDU88_001087 [Pleurodeles waltl]